MKKQVYEIEEDGFLKEIYVAEVDEQGNILDEDKADFIAFDITHGLFKAKWTGTEWIEGESVEEKEERESTAQLKSLIPTPQELADADLEIKILTLLMGMEVI